MIEAIKPSLNSTKVSPDFHEWIPSSFGNFLHEMEHIISLCEGTPYYRGITDYEWLLDSTFVRNCISYLFKLPDYQSLNLKIRQSIHFHRALASLLFIKLRTMYNLSAEIIDRGKKDDIDPWFEFLKNLQQYPEQDFFIKGTFIIDWTFSKDIALYFATYDGGKERRRIRHKPGALWICDAKATGKTQPREKLREILNLMETPKFLDCLGNEPLIFYPAKQTLQPRALNQDPIYISQMDFRYDLADIWVTMERQRNNRIFIKLITPLDTQNEFANYLETRGISEDHVYPE